MNSEYVRLERQKLYEEVWSTPMAQLASQYRISDVGLAKVCRKLAIPIPGRGYWQKKKAGQPVQLDPLPPLAEGRPKDVVRFRRAALPARAADVQARIDAEKRPDSLIVVPPAFSEAHPLVANAQESLARAKEDTCGLLAGGEVGGLDLKVGTDSLERALRIMDALLKALDGRGFTVSVDEKKRTTATVLGESVAFALEELVDRTERPLTPAQEKDKARNPWKYSRPQYDYSPSGRLSIKITDPSWGEIGRRSWSDGKKQRIENVLNAFMAALIQAAAAEREHRIQREKWAREQAERERRQREWQRRKQAEERQLWALFTDAECWQKSQQIRAYVQAVQESAERTLGRIEPASPLEEWIGWARQQADRLDPLAPFSHCTREDRHDEPSPYQSAPQPVTDFTLSWKRLVARSDYFDRSTGGWSYRSKW